MNETLDFIKTLRSMHDLALGGDFNLAVGIRHVSETVSADPPWLLGRLRREFNISSYCRLARWLPISYNVR